MYMKNINGLKEEYSALTLKEDWICLCLFYN